MKKKSNILFNLLLITIFFNIWFPKAGLKLSGIPLTVGNIFLAITFAGWILDRIIKGNFKIIKVGYFVLILILYSFIKYLLIGNFIDNVGYIVPLVIYPLIFFIAYDLIDSKEKMLKVVKVICYGFFFICFYALLQYIFGIEKVCVPGLTVNLSDYRMYGAKWYLHKNNNNGGVGTKIISTFQNGNLFGVNTLLFYPVVYKYYKNKNNDLMLYFSLALFIVTVFLSLSRACWLGIFLFILFGIFVNRENDSKNLLRKVVMFFLCIGMLVLSFKLFPTIANRLLGINKNSIMSMSGRTDGFKNVIKSFIEYKLFYIWIIGSNGFISRVGLAYEMTPLAILVQIGLLGIYLFYGFLFKSCRLMDKKDWIGSAIKLSIFIWFFVGCIEGAFWLPPTSLNIFLLVAIGLASTKINKTMERGIKL